MKNIVEPSREIPVSMKVDVVVAGAGPSGFAAAVAAARNGVEVLLVEKDNFVGGLLACLAILGFHNDRGKQVIFGIAQELVDRLVEQGASPGHIRGPSVGSPGPTLACITPTDTERLKVVTQEIVEEAGVKLLFHTFVAAPIMEKKEIKGIIVENKSGRQAILADVVIDATGDGDVAARAGAPYEIKDRERIQPANLMFRMDNVNVDKLRLAIAENPANARTPAHEANEPEYYLKAKKFTVWGFMEQLKKAKEKGDIPSDFPQSYAIIVTQPREDEVALIMAMVTNFHSTDSMDLTRAEMEARKRIPVVVSFLKKYVPGFKDAHLIASHSIIGVRESRRIMGDYVLTTEDVLQEMTFSDGIAIAPWAPSLGHHPKGKMPDMRYARKGLRGCEVPYRCLLPKGIEALLVAGRCISVTEESQNAIRVMAPCMALGQAAGTAAALAVNEKIRPRVVDGSKLQATLVKQGVQLLEERK